MLIDTLKRALASSKRARLPARRAPRGPGRFVDRAFANGTGNMSYKVYLPETLGDEPPALLVMLHGCGQTPEDFAIGTRMNEIADEHGFLVVYPAQSKAANAMNCWNWFNEGNQLCDRGEPCLIAGLTREVASSHAVDERRIFVAGLSAGGAMAVILAATYPELFAGVGVHSGLPYGAARDASSAFAAMRGSSAATGSTDSAYPPSGGGSTASRATPTIVFHGDQDSAVDLNNGSAIVHQAVSLAERAFGPLQKTVHERESHDGRVYTTTSYSCSGSPAVVEYWVLHAAEHAWSGGSTRGSFTDATGPDASAEMVRFFFSQSK